MRKFSRLASDRSIANHPKQNMDSLSLNFWSSAVKCNIAEEGTSLHFLTNMNGEKIIPRSTQGIVNVGFDY